MRRLREVDHGQVLDELRHGLLVGEVPARLRCYAGSPLCSSNLMLPVKSNVLPVI